MALLVLTTLVEACRARRWTLFVGAGLLAGLLPFANFGALLALMLMFPAAVLFLRDRGWLTFGATTVAMVLPQITLMRASHGGALRAFRWQPGWVASPDPWPWFWLKNLGVLAPLAIVAVLNREILTSIHRVCCSRSALSSCSANLFVFQPWDWTTPRCSSTGISPSALHRGLRRAGVAGGRSPWRYVIWLPIWRLRSDPA